MQKSESINELAAALAKAQGEIEGAIKDSSNPFFKSNYADLAAVWEACRGPLSKNGLAIVQTTEFDVADVLRVTLRTTLAHSSGQWISSTYPVVTSKPDAQGLGAGMTYARRYALAAILSIPQIDDDGNVASGRSNEETRTPRTTPNQAPAIRNVTTGSTVSPAAAIANANAAAKRGFQNKTPNGHQ